VSHPDSHTSPAWLADGDAVAACVQRCHNHTTLALDTEFMRTDTFWAKLALVQIGAGEEIALVDPLGPGVLDALRPLIADPAITKIVHSASEDLEVLHHVLGVAPAPLFDTQVAASLCGITPPPSYQKLVAAELGITLDKHATRTDWLKRPLDAEQLRYAAEDVEHLPAVYQRLHARLAELGRLDWLAEDCARMVAAAGDMLDPQPQMKVRSLDRMTAPQQRLLWRLLRWRDAEAMARDRPKKWILDPAIATRVALLDKPDRAALEKAVALDGRPSPRLAQKIEEVIARGPLPGEDAIAIITPPSEAEKNRQRDLKAQVDARAAELGIAPEILLPRRGLEHWARHDRLPPELSGWREGVLGLSG
jgi:ribonuclease D